MDKLQKYNRFAIYSAAIFFLLIIINGISGVLSPLDNRWLDTLVAHHAQYNKPDNNIVVINIDEDSLHQLNSVVGEWPWPRSVYANLINSLTKQHPKAIVFDIFFADYDVERAVDDQEFIDSLSTIDNVFLPVFEKTDAAKTDGKMIVDLPSTLNFSKSKQAQIDAKVTLVMPNAIPSELWKVGAINQTLDSDNVERRYTIYRTIAGWRLPSLPARLANYLGIPIPAEKEFIMDWQHSNPIIYPTFSFSQVLVNLTQNIDYPAKNYFADKIIVIGSTSMNPPTNHVTPISHEHPSAQVLATAIDNLKNVSFLSQPFGSFLNTLIALLSLLYVFMLLIKTKHHLLKIVCGLTLLSAIFISVSYFSVNHKILIPVASQLLWIWLYFLINFIWQYGRTAIIRYRVRVLFERSVSAEMLQRLSENNMPQHRTQEINIAVLCCSIQNFSAFTKQHNAETLVALLNDYFNEQVTLVFQHHGTIDNINGGTLIAFWGAPMPCENKASLAVSTAIHMIDNLKSFKMKNNLTTFDISIGVHTGIATVGMVGATTQLHYTVIGHTISITKAITSLVRNKSAVIISADTKMACASDFNSIELGKHCLLPEKVELRLFEPKRKYL